MKYLRANKLAIEPWGLSLNKREEILKEAKKDGKRIALYYAKGPDSSTFRYRCFNTYQATLRSDKWQAVFFYKSEIEAIKNLLDRSDLLVLGRQSRWDGSVKEIIDYARKRKIPVIFDLDDLVFDKKYLTMVINTIGDFRNLDYWVIYFDDMNRTARNVDGFLATNDYLGEKMKASFDKPYMVIRNSLNNEQIAASSAYLEFKEYPGEHDGFKIGYFSGSPTHINDLDVALPEVLAFLKRHRDAVFYVVGLMEFSGKANDYLMNGKIKFLPPVDFRKLQRTMCNVDVNIAPLVTNYFTNCKSELKFFEAAAVETTTIASPTYAFEKAITDGKNGFLAQPGEWYDKLEYLYKHPKENREIAKRAREYALKHYYGKDFLKEVEKAYDYFAK